MNIDWKEVAKQNNMTYEEFGDELIRTTMSYMGERMKEEGANTMIVKTHPYKLTCEVKKKDTK